MKIGYTTGHASGESLADCHLICLRWDGRREFSPDYDESWVVQLDGTSTRCLHGGQGWFTGLWRSPGGRVFVSDSKTGMHVSRATGEANFDVLPLDKGPCAGVWGVDESFVITWGLDRSGPFMYRWDGQAWGVMPSPQGQVVGVHGLARDFLYAVGVDGLIARWDGKAWARIAAPVTSVLSAVHVVSPEEIYAVGPGRSFLEGSIHGWSEVLHADSPLYGVAKFRGEVFVGAGINGLQAKHGATLDPIKGGVDANVLDGRINLLVSCTDRILGTVDGKSFSERTAAEIGRSIQARPAWLR
jgi:hypothetical protein